MAPTLVALWQGIIAHHVRIVQINLLRMLWRIYLFVCCKSDKSHSNYAPAPNGRGIKRWCCLTSVCFSVWCLSVCRLSVAYMERRPDDHDLWPFDLEGGVRVMCDVCFPRPLCFWLWHDVRDRQTSVRQTDVRQTDRQTDRQTSPCACGLRGCKNRPAPFPGRISENATKLCLSWQSCLSA